MQRRSSKGVGRAGASSRGSPAIPPARGRAHVIGQRCSPNGSFGVSFWACGGVPCDNTAAGLAATPVTGFLAAPDLLEQVEGGPQVGREPTGSDLHAACLVVAAVRQETSVIPIVFVDVSDPIGPGFVASLARPGGNLTGLLTFEAGIVGKWLAMLKEIAPGLARVALVGNSKTTAFDYFLRAAMDAAPSLGIEVMPHQVETASDMERVVQTVGRISDSGLIFPPDTTTVLHRDFVIALAARHRLPAVYPFRFFVTAGGLMSYSTDFVFVYRQAASYIDRILRGAKPADIPVQAPTKFETVLNLKTAKTLGLTVPPGLLVAHNMALSQRCDRV
jgi:putative tryptophan/tyrosine transport system substrate-binding protein